MKVLIYSLVGIVAAIGIYSLGSFGLSWALQEDSLQKINNIQGVETCESISSFSYATFMIFNPPDKQTYYYQSSCYQGLATETADKELCDMVVERESLFFDGSGVSREACLKNIAEKQHEEANRPIEPEGMHDIDTMMVTTTPTGDFEVNVSTRGTYAGAYDYTISLLDMSGNNLGSLYDQTMSLSDNDKLSTTVSKTAIEKLVLSKNKTSQKYFYLEVEVSIPVKDNPGMRFSNQQIKKILL